MSNAYELLTGLKAEQDSAEEVIRKRKERDKQITCALKVSGISPTTDFSSTTTFPSTSRSKRSVPTA